MSRVDVGLVVRLILAFVLWNLLALYLLPAYSFLLVPVAEGILDTIQPHDTQLAFLARYPTVEWEVTRFSQTLGKEQTSFRLIAYNLVLYLTALSALRGQPVTVLGILLATGLPVLYIFHLADLLLVVESKLLTQIRPDAYSFWKHFDPWFVVVKFSHSFSVISLKQVFPLLLLWLQYSLLNRRFAHLLTDEIDGETPHAN